MLTSLTFDLAMRQRSIEAIILAILPFPQSLRYSSKLQYAHSKSWLREVCPALIGLVICWPEIASKKRTMTDLENVNLIVPKRSPTPEGSMLRQHVTSTAFSIKDRVSRGQIWAQKPGAVYALERAVVCKCKVRSLGDTIAGVVPLDEGVDHHSSADGPRIAEIILLRSIPKALHTGPRR